MKVMSKTNDSGLYYLEIMVAIYRKHLRETWFHNVTVLGKRLSRWKFLLTKGQERGFNLMDLTTCNCVSL